MSSRSNFSSRVSSSSLEDSRDDRNSTPVRGEVSSNVSSKDIDVLLNRGLVISIFRSVDDALGRTGLLCRRVGISDGGGDGDDRDIDGDELDLVR